MLVSVLPTPVTPASKEAARKMTLAAALSGNFRTDAHFVAYAPSTRRLTLADISAMREEEAPFVEVVPLDYDLPGHGVWADFPEHAERIEALRAEHPVLKGCGVYRTEHGARLLVQVAPIPVTHYGSLLVQLYEALEDIPEIDGACKDPTRLFRLPNVRRARWVKEGTRFEARDEREVRSEAFLPEGPTSWLPPKPLVRGAAVRVGKVPEGTAPDMHRYRDPKSAPLKGDLAPLKGTELYETLARKWPLTEEVGGRHAAIVTAVGTVVRLVKARTVRAVIDLLGHSVAQMIDAHPTDPRSPALWGELVEVTKWTLSLAQGERDSLQEEREAEEREEEDAFARIGVLMGCTSEEARRRLVVYSGRAFYVFSPDLGRYVGEFTEVTLPTALRDHCPLIDPLAYSHGQVVGLRAAREVLHAHGATASETVYNYSGTNTFDGRTLHVSETAQRKVAPVRHADIERWLSCFGPKLTDWLAGFTRVDRPTAIIYLRGGKGTGKSFLARLLAGIFSDAYTPLDGLAGAFNANLRRSPLVWGDEGTGGWGDKDPSVLLRRLATTGSQSLSRKYLDESRLDGFVRVVLTANNEGVIDFRKALNADDIAALEERVLFLTASADAAQVLREERDRLTRALGFDPSDPNAPNALEYEWHEKGRFAEHVEWLRLNHRYTPGYRLLVEGGESHWSTSLRTRHGSQYPIVAAVAHACAAAARVEGEPVVLANGGVWVNATSLLKQWEGGQLLGERPPAAGVVSRGLATLANEETKLTTRLGRVNYRRVNVDDVVRAGEELGLPRMDTLSALCARTFAQALNGEEDVP
jgi:hypothetical protein